jgi:large repetitive protein
LRVTLRRPGLRTALTSLVAAVCLVAGVLGVVPAASAAVPVAPTGLAPATGASVSATPVLSWARVSGATSYDVEVSAQADFNVKLYTATTVNRRATPSLQLPMSDIYWRVRGKNVDGAGEWATTSFARTRIAGPVLQSPADGEVLDQPDEPVVLRWAPIPGATSYNVEIDNGPGADWIGSTTSTTKNTSFTPDSQPSGSYAWRVTTALGAGQLTFASTPSTYTVGDLAPVTGLSPAGGQDVEDVVLDWEPVAGAVKYEIRVSTDDQFPANTIVDQRQVTGTRYSPLITYDVDDYWWQVRAVDAQGAAKQWSAVPIQSLQRTWDPLVTSAGHGTDPNPAPDPYGAPRLLFPADAVAPPVTADMHFQWAPVRHATKYRLDIGPDQSFSPGTFDSCFTNHTTLVPAAVDAGECLPGLNTTFYWRVKALDLPQGVEGYYSPIRKFVYSRPQVTLSSPASGATVDLPSVSWQPVTGAEQYKVTLTWSDGVITDTTYSTSWSPADEALDPATGPFRWTVQAIDRNNVVTPLPFGNPGRTFALSGNQPTYGDSPLDPQSSGAATMRMPSLRWEPLPGADHYRIAIGTAGSNSFSAVAGDFHSAVATDRGKTHLAGGSYDWFVQAFNDENTLIGQGPTGSFTVLDPEVIVGQQVALSGITLSSGSACAYSLLDTPAARTCPALPATPVIDWQTRPDAAYYLVYLSRDRNFQNMVYGSYSDSSSLPWTLNSRWTETKTLPESQAGTAYYWFIRPCKAQGVCAQDPLQANHAFEKRSLAVATQAVDETTNDITFSWDPYLATNQTATAHPVTGEKPDQEARAYEVQVSTTSGFDTLLDTAKVDQPTYTAFSELYPEGNLYWRVRAYDGDDRPLPWSATRALVKSSPRSTPSGPTGTALVTQPFRWTAAPFATRYDLEVYKNGDTAASPANRVIDDQVSQVAYIPITPLPSGVDYVWRTRRVDASNNAGAWSDWASFRIEGEAPTLELPAVGASVPTAEGLFTWRAVEGATSYRFERRETTSQTIRETVNTPSLARAPTAKLTGGAWQWRVSSLDANGLVVKASAWQDFTVTTAPTATTATRISGSGSVGELLTGTDPVWSLPDVVNTYQWLRAGTAIPGANGINYEVVTADLGKALSLRVTGTAAGYDAATSDSNAITGVSGPAPTASVPPSIAGSNQVGAVLTATRPTWDQSGVTETYKWLRDGVAISGQTTLTYTIVSADAGKALTWQVTGKKTGYSDAVLTSNTITGAPGAMPVLTSSLAVNGDGRLGTTLTVAAAVWDQAGVATTYQWLRDGTAISGQTGTSYTVTSTDIGKTLRLQVTGKKAGYADAVLSTTGVTAYLGAPPAATSGPTVNGTARVGSTLTVTMPTWDQAGVTTTSTWLRDGVTVGASNATSYAVTTADIGRTLSYRVTGKKAGYADAVVASAGLLATAGPAPTPSTTPVVTGTAQVGQKLTVNAGSWGSGVTLTYQWLRDGAPIAGAVSTSYLVTPTDATRSLSVKVAATRTGYDTGGATTAPVAIAKMTSTTTLTLPSTAELGKKIKGSVTVVVPGLAGPTGQVRILDGKKVVATVTLSGSGTAKVKIKKLAKGKHKLTAVYAGTPTITGSTSKRVVLKVTT